MFNKRLIQLRNKENISQYELARRLGFSRGQIGNYEQGERKPDYDTLKKIADYFGVTRSYLLGDTNNPNESKSDETINIPVVAEISCGYPRFTEQEIIDYFPTDDSLINNGGEYVWLIAKGDSMTGANILPDSMVLLRLQPDVENGEISAVCVDEEKATLKRIYKSDGQITLVSENPIYKNKTYDSKRIRIVGKATFVGTNLE